MVARGRHSTGFRESETLHTRGYFRYANEGSGTQDPIWTLENSAFAGRYLRLDNTGNVMLSTILDTRSQWTAIAVGSQTVLQNVATGEYLDADGSADGGNVNVSTAVELDDQWLVVDQGAAGVTLRNLDTNGYLDGDSANVGWNVDQSVAIENENYWIRNIVVPGTFTTDSRALPDAPEISFAAFGDYGIATSGTPRVSSLIDQLLPDIIVTTGDARYSGQTYAGVHSHYLDYLHDAQASSQIPDGGASSINRFFPAPGNHEYDDGGGIGQFTDFFALPGDDIPSNNSTGSELYYDFQWGPVHFFVIDSDQFIDSSSSQVAQTAWLETELAGSAAPWQVVVMHHSPWSSSSAHGSNPVMQLDYASWGADLVLSGHDHTYERLQRDGITYVVTGLGGRSTYGFGSIETGSVARYSDDYGVALFTASATEISGSFVSVDGVTRDTFLIAS